MRSGQVSSIQYSGITGGLITEGKQCAYAVGNCLSQSPQPVRNISPTPSAQQPTAQPSAAAPARTSACTHNQQVQARIAREMATQADPSAIDPDASARAGRELLGLTQWAGKFCDQTNIC
jgi:hypothetical protein